MECCLDTTHATPQQLQEYARQLLIFINEYDWITHAYIVEYFKKDHWNSLPSSWQHCLQGLTPPQVAKYITDPNSSTPPKCVWPLSLLAYKATVRTLSIPRHTKNKTAPQAAGGRDKDKPDLSHCYRLHVKPKKRYEIESLAQVINTTCQESQCKRVVDVGSGQGHLSRLLSFGYGLPVTSIEAVGCHITGAAKFDREVKDFIEKKKRKEPSQGFNPQTIPPEHVVCTVHPKITVEEFLSVLDTSCKQQKVDSTIDKEGDGCIPAKSVKMSRVLGNGSTSSANTVHSDINDSENTPATLSGGVLPDGQNFNNEIENVYLMAGLHTCGDLGPTMLRVYAKCPSIRTLVSVGCCYMKMSCAFENSLAEPKKPKTLPVESMTNSKAGGSGVAGFPMSEWVKGQRRCDLDFQPLELGCHSFDVYCQRLKANDPNLVLQGYRAMLEILIQRQCPELVKQHAGVCKIKRVIGKIKKSHEIPFEQYASAALKKLDLTYDPAICHELCEAHLPHWHHLVIYHSLRLMIGPLIEVLVLVDRMLFLLEQGIDSKLMPVFDPLLSPRNFVLLATKRH